MKTIDELRAAGLLETAGDPQMTDQGRNWLRSIDDLEAQEVVEGITSSADVVASSNAIYR
jgi:hypothetical protein